MNKTITYTNAIHLQSYGLAPALPAEALRIGETTVWNYGGTETIKAITPKGATQLTMLVEYDHAGETRTAERVLKKGRLVGVTKATWVAHGRDPNEKPEMDMAKLARSIYGRRQ